jgi:peptidoglycan/LPS O-acetylase OafA/YrhL
VEAVETAILRSTEVHSSPAVTRVQKTSEPSRIAELDGIRALAIMAVLATHYFANEFTTPAAATLHGFGAAAFALAAHGWLGVDLFFVLSGFLITGILLDTRSKTTYFRDFWVRRALRILPLVFVVVGILTVIYRPHWLYVFMAFFFAIDFAQLIGLGNRAMGPLWSLAVEEQFYLIWPFLVMFLPKRALAITTLVILIAEPVVRLLYPGPLDLPWFRVDGLAMGALIALFVRSRYFSRTTTLQLCAAALLLAGVLFLIDVHVHTALYGLRISEADLLFGVMIAGSCALAGNRWLAPLRSRAARFVADTSFCAYLIHVPLQDLARHWGAGAHAANPFAAAALQASVAIPATFILAALSRAYLEVPFLRLKNRFAPAGVVRA